MFEIGTTLREARMRAGLDIQECERQTKIRAKYLRAMEEEEFDVLPAPAYVRGFLKSYAEHLGLDGRLVLDEYESRFLAADRAADDVPRRQSAADRRRKRRAAGGHRRGEVQLLWTAMASVLGVSVIAWGGFGGTHDDPGEAGTEPLPIETVTEPVRTAPTARAPDPTPVTRPLVVSLAGLDPQGSYLEVRGRSRTGRVVFQGTLEPGATRRFSVDRGLWMLVGQTAGLRLTVNGVVRPLRGGTAAYQITRRGIVRQPTG